MAPCNRVTQGSVTARGGYLRRRYRATPTLAVVYLCVHEDLSCDQGSAPSPGDVITFALRSSSHLAQQCHYLSITVTSANMASPGILTAKR